MIMPPRISVVMPLYNKAPYVNEAIRSALNQDIPVTEIIVIDDGSTDTGPAIVASIPDPRIRLITQPNAGVSVARNNGISAATGDYIAFLDADDRYQPGFLAGITKLIQNFPQAGMFCSAYTCFWADDTRRDRGLTKAAADTALYVPDFYAAWSKSAFTYTSAIVVSRKLFENATLRFPQGEKLGEDQDLWFRIAEKTPVAYLNTSLVDYRMDVQDSATQNQTVLEILPCYARLGERLANGSVPLVCERAPDACWPAIFSILSGLICRWDSFKNRSIFWLTAGLSEIAISCVPSSLLPALDSRPPSGHESLAHPCHSGSNRRCWYPDPQSGRPI